jgi:hypothetical protein
MAKYAAVGDKVKIVVPEIFKRCGYALTAEVLRSTRTQEIDNKVQAAAQVIAEKPKPDAGVKLCDPYDVVDRHTRGLLTKAVCSYIMNNEGWGGRERKIYEEHGEHLRGAVCTVESKRFVRTGTYTHGRVCGSYYDEPEWEPPYLDGVKTHCVYTLTVDNPASHSWEYSVDVVASNCEKL